METGRSIFSRSQIKICEKYGLPPLEFDAETRKGKSYAQWQADKKGAPTWKKIIRADIDYIISISGNEEDLFLIWKKSVIRFVREILKSMVRIFHFVQWNKKEVGEVTTLDLGIIMRRSFKNSKRKICI